MGIRTVDVMAKYAAGGRSTPSDTGSVAFSRAAYLRAKVLDSLASQCHEQGLLFDSLNHEEMADAYREASAALSDEARKLFPLYPHPDFIAGQQWAHDNGFQE